MKRDADGEGAEIVMGTEYGKSASEEEMLREGEIQELLDRPRVMTAAAEPGNVSRSATGSLHRRRISTDLGLEIELSPRNKSGFKPSVHVAEVLAGRV